MKELVYYFAETIIEAEIVEVEDIDEVPPIVDEE